MRVFKLPKKSGGYRTIHAPSKKEKAEYRSLIPPLTALCQKLERDTIGYEALHGFMPGRSAVTNAMQHVGDWEYTLNFDLKDFFDSVGPQHFYWLPSDDMGELGKTILGKNCIPCHQGLPTSPVLANIAFLPVDKGIIHSLAREILVGTGGFDVADFRYTRYADDITISVGKWSTMTDREMLRHVKSTVEGRVALSGFAINPSKTRVQWSRVGRREVTGVMVDQHGVYPTRRTRERLRAALHQQNAPQVAGLTEWCKMRTPLSSTSVRKALSKYREAWGAAKRYPKTKGILESLMIAENNLKVAAYVEGLDPSEVMRRAHEKV